MFVSGIAKLPLITFLVVSKFYLAHSEAKLALTLVTCIDAGHCPEIVGVIFLPRYSTAHKVVPIISMRASSNKAQWVQCSVAGCCFGASANE